LENGAQQLLKLQMALADVEKKLQAAQEGKLKELAELQSKIASEKALLKGLKEFASAYEKGLSFAIAKKDFGSLRASVGTLTDDATCVKAFTNAQEVIANANAWIESEQVAFNSGFAAFGQKLRDAIAPVPGQHSTWDQQIADKTAQLQAQGLSGGIAQLTKLMEQRAAHVDAIAKLVAQQPVLAETRQRRDELLKRLHETRDAVTERRKAQLQTINQSFKETIEDYAIYLFYDPTGICDEYTTCVLDAMHGTYLPEATATKLCQQTTPADLANLVAAKNTVALAAVAGLGQSWAEQLIQRLGQLKAFHSLQVANKPPRPRIRVLTKTTPQVEIPVNQLSDGQKHTILLTIAMLAESNDPLIIDQPEDDLDNAFIFKSVVKTLRYIKERRQVIVVTHNANIAVLGDSELLFPMKRMSEKGRAIDRGSVDRSATKQAVIEILEGGGHAFLRRRAIYGV
jgi:chorismate mutase